MTCNITIKMEKNMRIIKKVEKIVLFILMTVIFVGINTEASFAAEEKVEKIIKDGENIFVDNWVQIDHEYCYKKDVVIWFETPKSGVVNFDFTLMCDDNELKSAWWGYKHMEIISESGDTVRSLFIDAYKSINSKLNVKEVMEPGRYCLIIEDVFVTSTDDYWYWNGKLVDEFVKIQVQYSFENADETKADYSCKTAKKLKENQWTISKITPMENYKRVFEISLNKSGYIEIAILTQTAYTSWRWRVLDKNYNEIEMGYGRYSIKLKDKLSKGKYYFVFSPGLKCSETVAVSWKRAE